MNKKIGAFVAILLVMGLSQIAFAHKSNPYLAYTMKAIAKDVALVTEPAKKPNPADVTDGMIMTAIIRTRTSVSQIQLAIERAGKYESGHIVKDELSPDFNDETPEKQKELMGLYPQYLTRVKDKLMACEAQLKVEMPKEPEARDFKALKATLTEIDGVMTEAHKLFRPEGP